MRRILELDPNHAGARSALGYSKFDGQWKTQDEVMTERGYVEYKGRWRLPQEIEIIEQERKDDLAPEGLVRKPEALARLARRRSA